MNLISIEDLEKYKAKFCILKSELDYLINKPNRTKKESNRMILVSRELVCIIKKLKKARKEALKNENK